MWRKPFLLGMLCGTLMTAVLCRLTMVFPPTRTPAIRVAAPPARVPTSAVMRSRDELPTRPLPRGWHAYPFNGQTVYVMPLADLGGLK